MPLHPLKVYSVSQIWLSKDMLHLYGSFMNWAHLLFLDLYTLLSLLWHLFYAFPFLSMVPFDLFPQTVDLPLSSV